MIIKTNTCIKCKDEWKVSLNDHSTILTQIDKVNLQAHGQLYSICEDCAEDGEYESVLV